MTVSPLAYHCANPASILYGQAIPPLSGTLTGVLAQDAGKVAAVFTSTAAALSPWELSHLRNADRQRCGELYGRGDASGQPHHRAGAHAYRADGFEQRAWVGDSRDADRAGDEHHQRRANRQGHTLRRQHTSLWFRSQRARRRLPQARSQGAHNLRAAYSGDANFLPSSSATAELAVGAALDFTMTATGATSQSIPKGSAATYNFSVAMLGAAMASPIALAVQGVPTGATSSINPSYIPPGGAVTSFTVTIRRRFHSPPASRPSCYSLQTLG